MAPKAPLLFRKERSWNQFDRNLRKHRLIQRLVRLVTRVVQWQVVRRDDGNHNGGAQIVQTAGGGKTCGRGDDYTDLNARVPIVEQHGIASHVGAGAHGLVIPNVGGVVGSAVGVGLRHVEHRPKVLSKFDVCLYHVAGTRTWLKDNGELRLETGLADYKASPADLDEGAKLRLHLGGGEGGKGRAELYGEDFVQQRAQPAGGEGASATTKLEATGKATFKVDDGTGTTATITMLDGKITVENSAGAKVELKADGNVDIVATGKLELQGSQIVVGAGATLAAARSTDPVNPGAPMELWAQTVETAINALIPGTFVLNTFALTVAPADTGNYGSIGSGSTTVTIKG